MSSRLTVLERRMKRKSFFLAARKLGQAVSEQEKLVQEALEWYDQPSVG